MATLAALAVLTLASACGQGSDEPADTSGAYYLEAVIEVDDSWAVTVGTDIVGATTAPTTEPSEFTARTIVRQWFEAPGKWRWELETTSDVDGVQTGVAIMDGTEIIFFQPDDNTFSRMPVGPSILAASDGLPWMPISILIGRVPGEDAQAFLASRPEIDEGTHSIGSAELEGRTVTLIEQSPLHCSSTDSVGRDGIVISSEESCGGKTLTWLDEERMLILRTEMWPDDEHRMALAEVTTYETDVQHDPALFKFTPPEGSVDVTDQSPTAISGAPSGR